MTPIEQVRESVTHELKCHPEPFQAVKRNEKRFEFRKDDRDYRVGDNLHLREWMPGSGWDNDGGNEGDYTGDECHRRVDYIIREGFGIPKGYCIMSLALLKTMEGETNPNDDAWAANMRLKSKTALINIIRSERNVSPQSDTLATLTLSMTEEPVAYTNEAELDCVKQSAYGKMWLDSIKNPIPLYTHTKTITVDEIIEVVSDWVVNDGFVVDTPDEDGVTKHYAHAKLRDRLTSKFK